jgi:hypothetical protein
MTKEMAGENGEGARSLVEISYPVPTLDLYENVLVNRLELNSNFDKKNGNLINWLEQVKLMPAEKVPPARANISLASGRKFFQLSSDHPLPEILPENPKSHDEIRSLLEAQALTAAKLSFITKLDEAPRGVKKEAEKGLKMIDKESDRVIDNLSKQREVAIPRQRISRRQFLGMAAAGAGSLVMAACSMAGPIEASKTPTQIANTPTATETYTPSETPTATATATETQKPTESAPFTEAEVEAASPFDAKTFPERFQKMDDPNYLVNATIQEKQDYDAFLKAVRVDKGIAKTTGEAELDNFYEARDWMQAHPDEVKEKQLKIVISSLEWKAMLAQEKIPIWHDTDGSTYGIQGVQLPTAAEQRYSSENLGNIAGFSDIDTERSPFDTAYGKIVGFGEIGGQNVILLDMKDPSGNHIIFPAVIYVGDGFTLEAGSKCIAMNSKNPIFILPTDTEFGPLTTRNRKTVDWKTLYDGVGKMVYINGGYYADIRSKFGNGAYCFSPDLNLEIASAIIFL